VAVVRLCLPHLNLCKRHGLLDESNSREYLSEDSKKYATPVETPKHEVPAFEILKMDANRWIYMIYLTFEPPRRLNILMNVAVLRSMPRLLDCGKVANLSSKALESTKA